ncbi:MAG: hypothetical protein AB7V16_03175 [Vulcanibacillus sp.]
MFGCTNENSEVSYSIVSREERLPDDIFKREPATDQYPPVLHSNDYEKPIPLSIINTAGAEDSPFILPDGKTLYFFFTPDVRVSPEQQLFDGVTGVWVSYKEETWSNPQRVWLNKPEVLSLDGAVSIQKNNEMWFASAREGYEGMNIFTAEMVDEKWVNWEYAGDRLMKEIQIGEVHINDDDLYFHSSRSGGKGGYDIWVTTRNGDSWSDPLNIAVVNTDAMDGYPYVSSDGNELWFTRTYKGTPAIFRSVKKNDVWGEPEMIVSQFAGEPTLDNDGNLYFAHHYYEDGTMIEADIYVAYKK